MIHPVITVTILLLMTSMSRQNEISLAQGKIKGVVRDGYISYYGIPYGDIKIPDGQFKRASLAPSWAGVRDVKTCQLEPDEDCLQLEVHAPAAGSGPWPVLVWVKSASGTHAPGALVNQDIIVVLVNYRDVYFLNHIYRSVRMRGSTSSSPIYFYQFSHSGARGVEEVPGVERSGAAHSDELAYLFSDNNIDGEDGTVQENLVNLWTDFVKYLNPTPHESGTKWEPVSREDIRLLDISTNTEMINFPYKRSVAIWDDLFERYYYRRQIK